jgi:hypothetical protein
MKHQMKRIIMQMKLVGRRRRRSTWGDWEKQIYQDNQPPKQDSAALDRFIATVLKTLIEVILKLMWHIRKYEYWLNNYSMVLKEI